MVWHGVSSFVTLAITIIIHVPFNFQKTLKPWRKKTFCFLKIKTAIIPDKDSEKLSNLSFLDFKVELVHRCHFFYNFMWPFSYMQSDPHILAHSFCCPMRTLYPPPHRAVVRHIFNASKKSVALVTHACLFTDSSYIHKILFILKFASAFLQLWMDIRCVKMEVR